jgi:DNA polymerase (family 10)
MEKHDLARIFNEIGLLLELKGENPFKTRAYYNAARTIENLTEDLAELIEAGRVSELPGFGVALAKKVEEWGRTGSIEYYENLKNTTPPGLFELLTVPGLGAKKINVLYQTLGIASLEMLEEACSQDKLLSLPGFGAKTQAKICAGIQFIKDHRGQFLLGEVWPEAVRLKEEISKLAGVLMVEIAGSLRRFKEVVKDIDLVASAEEPGRVICEFINLPLVTEIIGSGETKGSVLLKNGVQADLRVVKPEKFPHALQHFTGSKEHNTVLRHYAKGLGYKVNEYGLFKEDGTGPIYYDDEAEIYHQLGLAYIPPELREDLGEIEAALAGKLPELIHPKAIKGIFHVHTNYSDGVNSLREMVEAAMRRGYQYLGIADHSQVAVYAGGLSKETLFKQFEEIEELNREYPNFRIFKGTEADILPSGELDYGPEILSQFDFVIGSIHSNFRMNKLEMTARILKAMDNPFLTMLGHATGRILLERPGYEVDLEAIIVKAASNNVILEFNANPYRLDLDWRWLKKAKECGVKIAINPDAHSAGEIDLVNSGLAVARKGWLESKDVLNTLATGEVIEFFKKKKAKMTK